MIVLYVMFTQLNGCPCVRRVCTLQEAYAAVKRALKCDCTVEQQLKLLSHAEVIGNQKYPAYAVVLS
jgi:hypothetical protein